MILSVKSKKTNIVPDSPWSDSNTSANHWGPLTIEDSMELTELLEFTEAALDWVCCVRRLLPPPNLNDTLEVLAVSLYPSVGIVSTDEPMG